MLSYIHAYIESSWQCGRSLKLVFKAISQWFQRKTHLPQVYGSMIGSQRQHSTSHCYHLVSQLDVLLTAIIVIACALAAIASCQVKLRLLDPPSVISTRKFGADERSPFDSTNIESRTSL